MSDSEVDELETSKAGRRAVLDVSGGDAFESQGDTQADDEPQQPAEEDVCAISDNQ